MKDFDLTKTEYVGYPNLHDSNNIYKIMTIIRCKGFGYLILDKFNDRILKKKKTEEKILNENFNDMI